jgi:hypothetical protein
VTAQAQLAGAHRLRAAEGGHKWRRPAPPAKGRGTGGSWVLPTTVTS